MQPSLNDASQSVAPEKQIREQKLPKWAQEELVVLRQNLQFATTRLSNIGKNTPTSIEVDVGTMSPIYLPKSARVRFHLNGPRNAIGADVPFREQEWVDVTIDSSGRLRLHSGWALQLFPESGNVALVTAKDWRGIDNP